MLLLLHALIPCLAYCTCFSIFWYYHPYILQHFYRNVLHLFHWFFVVANITLFASVRTPPYLAACGHVKRM